MSATITCQQFKAIVVAAAEEMDQNWAEQARREPQVFPEAMTANDWWLHFSTVSMPERLLRGSLPKPEARA